MHEHERQFIAAAQGVVPLVHACRDEIERERELPGELVRALADAGFFRMYVPAELGGLEVHPAAMMEAVEAVAAADGSAGWIAALCGSEGLYLARLPPESARAILASGTPGIAGSFNAGEGRAVAESGGYRVTGRWRFGSGCRQATWMMAAGARKDASGNPALDAAGRPAVTVSLFPRERCTIFDTWYAGGLRGSGSHDFALDDYHTPEEFTFGFETPSPYRGALYRMPILVAFGPGVATVSLGIARGAITELQRLAAVKRPMLSAALLRDRTTAQLAVAEAEALVRSARLFLLDAVGAAWAAANEGREVSLLERASQRLASWHAAQSATRAVRLMYEAAGTSAVLASNPIERAIRDVEAASLHVTVAPSLQEAAGRVLLGLESGTPLI
jgi:alkylation response protein AidB-like acyl-CoA dehydrogenase